MKSIVAMVLVILVLGIGAIYYLNSNNSFLNKAPTTPIQNNKQVAKQAGFAIFTNGTFREFSASMYHNLSKDVFIESTNPNIVKVKKENITWDDFFSTLPFKLSQDCLTTGTGQTFCTGKSSTLKFYLNGELHPDSLNTVIGQGDKLLVSFGNNTQQQIQKQLEKIPDPNF